MEIVTWECPVDDSAIGRYNVILGIYILTALGLNIDFFEHVIESGDIPLKVSTAPMVGFGT